MRKQREQLLKAISNLTAQVIESRVEVERMNAAALELVGIVKSLKEENQNLREKVDELALAMGDGGAELVEEQIQAEREFQKGLEQIISFGLGGGHT